MNKTKLPSPLEATLLTILINGEKYGREIRNDYECRMSKKLPLGSLYTTLNRMEEIGFIDSRMDESVHPRGGYKRRYFRITGVGQQAISEYQIFVTSVMGGALFNA